MSTDPKKTALIGMIKTLLKPSTIIALTGPTILAVNRDSLAASLRADSGEYSWLNPLVENPGVYALIEHNVQIYTLIMAWVLLQGEAFAWGYRLFRSTLTKALAQHSMAAQDKAMEEAGDGILQSLSPSQLVLVAVLLLQFFVVVIFVLLSGALAGPSTVALYRPVAGVPLKLHIPPVDSIISWARIGVAFLGVWVASRQGKDT